MPSLLDLQDCRIVKFLTKTVKARHDFAQTLTDMTQNIARFSKWMI